MRFQGPCSDIDTRLLRSFLAVAAEQSVSQGARRLGCSQGTMSLRIRKLEERLGLRLFERGRYNFKLTSAGRDLLPGAQAFVDMHDRVFGRARAKLVSGAVRLGVGEGCGFDRVPGLLRRVQAHYPNIRFSIRCGLGHELRAGVEAGECELAIFALPEPVPSATILSRARLHWVARPDFAFEKHSEIPVAWFPDGCFFRVAGEQALEARRHRVLRGAEQPRRRSDFTGRCRRAAGVAVMAEGTVPGDLRVFVRPLVVPHLGLACIQLLESSGPLSDAALAIRREILGLYSGR